MCDGGEGGPPVAVGFPIAEGSKKLVVEPPLGIQEFTAASQGLRGTKGDASDDGIVTLGFVERQI